MRLRFNVPTKLPAHQNALTLNLNIHLHILQSLDLIPNMHKNPFPTHTTPLQTHCPNCFSDVRGVTASPASSSTHISPQRLDPQTLTSPGNTELSAAH